MTDFIFATWSQEAPPCQRVLRLYLLPRDSRVEIIHCPVVFEQFKLGFVIVPSQGIKYISVALITE